MNCTARQRREAAGSTENNKSNNLPLTTAGIAADTQTTKDASTRAAKSENVANPPTVKTHNAGRDDLPDDKKKPPGKPWKPPKMPDKPNPQS